MILSSYHTTQEDRMNNFHQSQYQRSHNRPRYQPPQLYSITRGTVTRIEAYGCFVRLDIDSPLFSSSSITPVTGLVHVSQLQTSHISNVNDVVNINDVVFVKVIEIFVETIAIDNDHDNNDFSKDSNSNHRRVRHKIKLSMKYVNQDTGQDLDVTNDQLANNNNNNAIGGKGAGTNDGGGVNSDLGRALASNIGISSAIDPGNLILKGKKTAGSGAGGNLFNGYALVGEDEGEEPAELSMSTAAAAAAVVSTSRPMGRGRGTTLPAWMTKRDEDEYRLGHAAELPSDHLYHNEDETRSRIRRKSSQRRRYDSDADDGDRSRRGHEKKKKKHSGQRRRRLSSSSSESDQKSHHRRRRSLSSSSSESDHGRSGNRRKRKNERKK